MPILQWLAGALWDVWVCMHGKSSCDGALTDPINNKARLCRRFLSETMLLARHPGLARAGPHLSGCPAIRAHMLRCRYQSGAVLADTRPDPTLTVRGSAAGPASEAFLGRPGVQPGAFQSLPMVSPSAELMRTALRRASRAGVNTKLKGEAAKARNR